MTKAKILIVDDEAPIRDMIRFNLQQQDFEIIEAGDSLGLKQLVLDHLPDLILLDWMLPSNNGINITRALKSDAQTAHVPIIMLTAKAEEQNKVLGLETGADDYIVKPFSPRELIARINAVLRRGSTTAHNNILQAGDLQFDLDSHVVQANNNLLKLSHTELRLLHFFITHPNKVYSREQLLNRLWGDEQYLDDRTVDATIRRLRKTLEPHGVRHYIQTIHGSGYRFVAETLENA